VILSVDEARYLARNDAVAATRGDDGEIRTLRGNEIEQAARERLARVRVEGQSGSAPGYGELATALLTAVNSPNPGLDYSQMSGAAHGERMTLASLGKERPGQNGIARSASTSRSGTPSYTSGSCCMQQTASWSRYSKCAVAAVRSCTADGPERFKPASRLSSRHSEVANDRVGDARDSRAVFAHVVGGAEGP
jgi:hypothetical protein